MVRRLDAGPAPGTLYGNVEIRQVDLAFNSEGTVLTMAKREGDAAMQGELLAERGGATMRDLLALAEACRDTAKAQLDLLLAGTRPEEIDRARANVAATQTALARDVASFSRLEELTKHDFASRQAYDDARMALDNSHAQLAQTQPALAEAIAGPRPQESDAARASLRQAEASVALAQEQLAHTRLLAPADGIVVTRVIEPGTKLPLVLETRDWFNRTLDPQWFIVPRLVAVLSLIISMLVSSLSLARERELGTFEQMLVTPLRSTGLMVGKALPAMIVGLLEANVVLAAALLWFRLPIAGNPLLLELSLLVYMLAGVGLGLAISAFARTQQHAILGVFVYASPAVILSGFASPIENMPQAVEWLSRLTRCATCW